MRKIYYNRDVKDLKNILKKRKIVAFLDLEGTQTSHEIIEIGLVKVSLKEDLSIKKEYKGLKLFVLPKKKIGNVVTSLTGLTDNYVKKEGIPFKNALTQIKKYMGSDYEKSLFFTYGNQDGVMFIKSYEENKDASFIDARFMASHCYDLSKFFSIYFSGKDGNPISLEKLANSLNVKYRGNAHDALIDAYALLDVYKAYLEKKELVADNYRQSLSNKNSFPKCIKRLIQDLNNNKSVTLEQFKKYIEEELKWAK